VEHSIRTIGLRVRAAGADIGSRADAIVERLREHRGGEETVDGLAAFWKVTYSDLSDDEAVAELEAELDEVEGDDEWREVLTVYAIES
jgi:hypothetical protein